MSPVLHVIIGSTRPGRVGPTIARWFHEFAEQDGQFKAVLIDLADFKLPLHDEPKHPRLKQYEHAHTRAWSASVAAADAYVFVTPEYNYSPSPSLTNALIYVYSEWNYKPAGIVSYGGVGAGLRAAHALKLQLAAQKMVPIMEGVPLPNFSQFIEGGVFKSNDLVNTSAKTMLGELAKWSGALKSLRVA